MGTGWAEPIRVAVARAANVDRGMLRVLSQGLHRQGRRGRSSATARYEPGLLALREGPLLEAAVGGLARAPDVLLVNATGRDHPRRAGLAMHLGAVLGLPTVGLTHRPLLAAGDWPDDSYGATSPLRLDGDVVGVWVRTRKGARPLAAHAAWRTDADQAAETVLRCWCRRRTPEPLREARRLARLARALSERSVR
jgi:deoxyribonuclease V